MYRTTVVLALACISVAALGREFRGHQVIDTPFEIAGGKTVVLPITDAGAIPAEDRKARIEVAGFVIARSKDDPRLAMIVWSFGLTNKPLKNVESIEVAEVAPAKAVVTLVHDTAPTFEKKYWKAGTVPSSATRESVPWLFSEGTSTFVFRFTINERGKDSRVYFQPASFSSEAKAHFRKMIERINGG